MMSSKSIPTITSFVIRFVVDQSGQQEKTPAFRGAIRHIQTEDEIQFSTWNDAVKFIQRFVPLDSGLASIKLEDKSE